MVPAGVHPQSDLLKNGQGWYLDDYRLITLLNAELKILAKILMGCFQSVAKSLLGLEQTCAVKRWTIQNNLHLICTILEGVKDDKQAAQIKLDQSKAFDRVGHQFLGAIRWIQTLLLYHFPSSVVLVKGNCVRGFVLSRLVQHSCLLSPLLYALVLETLLCWLWHRVCSPALHRIAVPGGTWARVSAYANDVSIFVSWCSDTEVVQKVLECYF